MRIKEVSIKRNGKSEKWPVHFGFNMQADFCDDIGIPIQEFDNRVGGEKMTLADIRALTWHALLAGHKRSAYKDAPFALTKSDVGDLFDENPTLITDVFTLLVDAQPKADGKAEGGAGNATEG